MFRRFPWTTIFVFVVAASLTALFGFLTIDDNPAFSPFNTSRWFKPTLITAAIILIAGLTIYTHIIEERLAGYLESETYSLKLKSSPTTKGRSPARLWFKILLLLFSFLLIFCGTALFNTTGSGAIFIGSFIFATGVQILLWLIGIRLEILGNMPSVMFRSEDRQKLIVVD